MTARAVLALARRDMAVASAPLSMDAARGLYAYQSARRRAWADYLTTAARADADDHDADLASRAGCAGARTPWAESEED